MILANEWNRARFAWASALDSRIRQEEEDERVPTFIIIDEAHNLIPVDPQGVAERSLLEQFRKIVAELTHRE